MICLKCGCDPSLFGKEDFDPDCKCTCHIANKAEAYEYFLGH